ncbi:MAG: DUF4339 domain-containing protein [Deltaproteobacteria bacterium]|nr:DUF4339 domain-containing protein [Deltaproteobacteria bacterium]
MKTTCEKCLSRYQIPDARVVGKVLRIRCKKCEHVMLLVGPTKNFDPTTERRPPTLTGFKPTDRPSAITQRPARKAPAWWCAISGKPHGPFTEDEVHLLVDIGDVYARTRMWRKGMDSWERLCESPSLAWAYDAVIQRVAEDDEFLQNREASAVLTHAGLAFDDAGYFPDPTMKSGWLILDEKTQEYLETVARANGLEKKQVFESRTSPTSESAMGTFAAMGLGMAMAAMGIFMLVQTGV